MKKLTVKYANGDTENLYVGTAREIRSLHKRMKKDPDHMTVFYDDPILTGEYYAISSEYSDESGMWEFFVMNAECVMYRLTEGVIS